MNEKHVFVTIGTTKFDKLIEIVSSDEVLSILRDLHYNSVQFQVGTGQLKLKKSEYITLKYDRYFENFNDEIAKADLVISHAGAGTCLEVLKQQKPLIVITNEDLMDNHQWELAQKLCAKGYVYWCTPDKLKLCLANNNLYKLQKYPRAETNKFALYLDRAIGFS